MKNYDKIRPFLPPELTDFVQQIVCGHDDLEIHVSKPRFSKWGDFRRLNGHCIISLNSNLNPYQFLITLLHEFAHYAVFKKYGKGPKPHGKEWKLEFGQILLDLIQTNKLPFDLSQAIYKFAANPRAAVTTDLHLKEVLERYTRNNPVRSLTISNLDEGDKFIFNGRIFERLEKRRKLIKCRDIKKNKFYLFQPDTIVKKI